jgi:hypothetical protein
LAQEKEEAIASTSSCADELLGEGEEEAISFSCH